MMESWKDIASSLFAENRQSKTIRHAFLVFSGATLLLLSSCIYIPTPEFGHMSGRAVITKSDIEDIKSKNGVITRERILLRLGDPNIRINNDEYFCYGWERIQGVWFTGDPSGYGGATLGVTGKEHWLCMQFDPLNKLIRIKNIEPILFGDAGKKRDQILQEWNKKSTSTELRITGNYYNFEQIKLEVVQSLAEKGYPEAQWNLYNDYGKNAEDIIWLCRSADNGFRKAQLEVGNIYWADSKIPQHQIKAFVWYKHATSGDNNSGIMDDTSTLNSATNAMRDAVNRMSPDQLVDAYNFYMKWEKGDCQQELVE